MPLLAQEWDIVTPFNVLAVYVQYDADAVPGGDYISIEKSFVQAVTRDQGFVCQNFHDRKSAAAAGSMLVSRLPGLNKISVDPLIALKKNFLQNADTVSNRVVIQLQGDHSFYLQYNSLLEARGFTSRIRQNLGLGG